MAEPDYPACASAGIIALQKWYEPSTGLWRSTGWWNAANALTALIDYTKLTGNGAHAAVIAATFTAAQRQHADFVNSFYDDNGWWGLAWVAAYDLTGEDRYLSAARTIFARNTAGWDDTCGGGLWWNEEKKYKNAITSELLITLAARLHQRTPAEPPGVGAGAGILIDPCETTAAGCDSDQVQFKGIFMRYLYDFWLQSRQPAYRAFILGKRPFAVGQR